MDPQFVAQPTSGPPQALEVWVRDLSGLAVMTPTSYQDNRENLFFRDPEIIDFGGLDGPCATPFGVVSGAPGSVQTPEIEDFWVPEK